MMTKEKIGSLEMSSINKNNKSTRIEDQIKGMKSNFTQFRTNLIISTSIREGLTKIMEIGETKGEADTDL